MERIKTIRNQIRIPLILLFIAVVAEALLFQFRFWTEAGTEPVRVPAEAVLFQAPPEKSGSAGTESLLLREDGSNVFQLDLRGIGVPVRSILILAECTDGQEVWKQRTGEPYAALESRAVWAKTVVTENGENRLLPDRMLGAGAEDSIRIPGSGKAEALTVMLTGVKGHTVRLDGIVLNAGAQFRFQPLRMLCLFAVLLLLWGFRPGSGLWERPVWDEQGKMHRPLRYAIVGTMLVLIPVILLLLRNHTVYLQSEGGFAFYRELAHALAEGHTWVSLEPSAELLAMVDPYDPAARLEQEVPFYLDYAFFGGKYYVYFGVIPCLLFYMPIYLLSGIDVPGWAVLSALVWLVCLGNALLLAQMGKRYRPDLSQASFGLAWIAVTAVMSLPAVLGDACNYYIPQLSGIVFFQYAMILYYRAAERSEKGRDASFILAAASLLMAFTAGARPQMVLGAAVALPPVFRVLFPQNAEKKTSPALKPVICFGLPFLLTAAGLMLYNAMRFGSVLEFGTHYNLTFAYVSGTGLHPQTAAAGLWYYLLRPFHPGSAYPYLQRTALEWSNPGLLASHPSIGGLFCLYPVLFAGLYAVGGRAGEAREKEWRAEGMILLLLVPALAAADALMGGLMDRYKLDFALFAGLAMACGIYRFRPESGRGKTLLRTALLILTVLAVLISALTYGAEGVSSLLQVNPEAYAALSGATAFWR